MFVTIFIFLPHVVHSCDFDNATFIKANGKIKTNAIANNTTIIVNINQPPRTQIYINKHIFTTTYLYE